MLSLHLVAAAEEVADAKVTAKRATMIVICCSGRMVNHDMLMRLVSQRAADIVATKNGENSTSINGNVHVVSRGV